MPNKDLLKRAESRRKGKRAARKRGAQWVLNSRARYAQRKRARAALRAEAREDWLAGLIAHAQALGDESAAAAFGVHTRTIWTARRRARERATPSLSAIMSKINQVLPPDWLDEARKALSSMIADVRAASARLLENPTPEGLRAVQGGIKLISEAAMAHDALQLRLEARARQLGTGSPSPVTSSSRSPRSLPAVPPARPEPPRAVPAGTSSDPGSDDHGDE